MIHAVAVDGLSHRYGHRVALSNIAFAVDEGSVFGLLGPNGSGKTTLFRLLATLVAVQAGRVTIFGCDLQSRPGVVRQFVGVTFQSPSLDSRLTVYENLMHQSHLYGLSGSAMRDRVREVLDQLSVADRAHDRAGTLSGGLQRRVEIAKSLLHRPRMLILDEPSTGLDPTARIELWSVLRSLQNAGVTVLLTTHLMDEAEKCDHLAILDGGSVVALGTPQELRASLGGDCLTLCCTEPQSLSQRIEDRFGINLRCIDNTLLIEREDGHELLRDLVATFPGEIDSVSLGKPTLEDVFTARTGRRFREEPT